MAKQCVECRSEIPDDARKCVQCGAVQTWRRHLTFSSTVLSLLVALVSVTGLAVPPLLKAFTPRTSNLSAQVLSIGEISADYATRMGLGNNEWGYVGIRYCVIYTVLMQNAGNAPGLLESTQIFLHGADGRIVAQGDYLVPAADAVIKPNDFRAVEIATDLTIRERGQFPATIRLARDRDTIPVDYAKGKVMLRLVGHDGVRQPPDRHNLYGRLATARLRKGGCGPR